MLSRKTSILIFSIAIFACSALCVQKSFSQSLQTSIDKKSILIGEQIHYELKFVLPNTNYTIEFNLPDSFPHFDIISKLKSDSTDANGHYLVMQRIVLTSFDSGKWALPSFPIKITNVSKDYTIMADSAIINVGYAPADSTGQLRDIKPVMDVFVIDNSWMYIIAGIVSAIIIFILLYRYFKNRPKKAKPVFSSSLSPYDEAMQSLKDCTKYNLHESAEIKEYHTALANIFKKYLSRMNRQNLMNRTTGDVLLSLKQANANEVVPMIAEALRTGDAVKFAKYISSDAEHKKSMEDIKAAIDMLEKIFKQNKLDKGAV
ncbi:MAG: hypothetical protein JSU03_13415 [Bacteroidetes bacterium]|nr:hypothetical protein [Bacteroidota bacterium]MBS1758268.1 hypothetical protein [Bacteroidota bacterium]